MSNSASSTASCDASNIAEEAEVAQEGEEEFPANSDANVSDTDLLGLGEWHGSDPFVQNPPLDMDEDIQPLLAQQENIPRANPYLRNPFQYPSGATGETGPEDTPHHSKAPAYTKQIAGNDFRGWYLNSGERPSTVNAGSYDSSEVNGVVDANFYQTVFREHSHRLRAACAIIATWIATLLAVYLLSSFLVDFFTDDFLPPIAWPSVATGLRMVLTAWEIYGAVAVLLILYGVAVLTAWLSRARH